VVGEEQGDLGAPRLPLHPRAWETHWSIPTSRALVRDSSDVLLQPPRARRVEFLHSARTTAFWPSGIIPRSVESMLQMWRTAKCG